MSKENVFVPTSEQIISLQNNLKEFAEDHEGNLEYEAFIDAHGHLIFRTKEPITTDDLRQIMEYSDIPDEYFHATAYMGIDIITLPIKDARAIDKILAKKIKKYGSSEDAFGSKAVSCERLYDRINGIVYPIIGKEDND